MQSAEAPAEQPFPSRQGHVSRFPEICFGCLLYVNSEFEGPDCHRGSLCRTAVRSLVGGELVDGFVEQGSRVCGKTRLRGGTHCAPKNPRFARILRDESLTEFKLIP